MTWTSMMIHMPLLSLLVCIPLAAQVSALQAPPDAVRKGVSRHAEDLRAFEFEFEWMIGKWQSTTEQALNSIHSNGRGRLLRNEAKWKLEQQSSIDGFTSIKVINPEVGFFAVHSQPSDSERQLTALEPVSLEHDRVLQSEIFDGILPNVYAGRPVLDLAASQCFDVQWSEVDGDFLLHAKCIENEIPVTYDILFGKSSNYSMTRLVNASYRDANFSDKVLQIQIDIEFACVSENGNLILPRAIVRNLQSFSKRKVRVDRIEISRIILGAPTENEFTLAGCGLDFKVRSNWKLWSIGGAAILAICSAMVYLRTRK